MNLTDKIIDKFIKNDKIDVLFNLLKSNKLIDKNNIIDMNILTNDELVIYTVESNKDLLNKFKYKNEILLIYYLINNCNKKRLNVFINNIIKFNNFNDNDETFLYFILYNNLKNINIKNKYKLLEKIILKIYESTHIQKIIGFIRSSELNLTEDYFKLLSTKNENNRDEFKDKYNYNNQTFKYSENLGEYIAKFELNNDFNFKIYEGYIHNRAEFWYENKKIGNIIKYDNKYYIENYKNYCGICARNYLIDETNRFITHASRNINDILPFLEEKCWELDEHYKGSIINNNYVKTNIFKNDINFSHANIYEILIECGMFL